MGTSLIFYKYHGTGNDFVMLDLRGTDIILDKKTIAQLCHRRFGVGSDGLITLQEHKSYDFRMYYYNADGGEGSMCGNGGRCAVQFAKDLGIIVDETTFLAVDGVHNATLSDGLITLKMIDVLDITVMPKYYTMDTGSPHYVTFVKALEAFPVLEEGKKIRYSEVFDQKGGNVNFAEVLDKQTLMVRTYERGVEDETYSCGTGVTACALAFALQGGISPIEMKTKGGILTVAFRKKDTFFEEIYLTGPAKCVFKGEIEL